MNTNKKLQILLINVCPRENKCFRSAFSKFLTYPSLTIAHIKAIINRYKDIEADTCDEFAGEKINFKKHYDIVMMNFMSIGAYRAYDLAEFYKKQNTYTVAGGYHASYMNEEVQKYFNSTVSGSADGSIPAFLEDYKKGIPKKLYKNIPDIENVEIIPDRSAVPNNKYIAFPPLTANPSCPNCCEYCVISDFNRGNKPKKIETIKQEIKQLKKSRIIFLDPNFFADRNYAIELMKVLKEIKVEWAAAAVINIAKDEEMLKMASISGATGFAIGFESFNEKSLKAANKYFNNPSEYKNAVDIIHKHNLYVNGFIMLGMDYDTKESLLNIPQMVDYLNLDLVKYSILTPMPNSKLYNKLKNEGRILTEDWRLYDQNHAVFQPKNMTKEELEEIYIKVWKETYELKRLYKRVFQNKDKSLHHKLRLLGVNLAFKYLGVK